MVFYAYTSHGATHETPGVIVFRSTDEEVGPAQFKQPPLMENPDIIAQMMSHRKVVSHYEQGEAKVLAQAPHEIDQLGLLHRIQTSAEPVANQQRRIREEGPRQRHLLPLDRIELDRVEITHRFGETARDHDRFDSLMPPVTGFAPVPQPEDLAKGLAHGLIGRQLPKAVREDCLHAPPHGAETAIIKTREVNATEDDPARRDALEPENGERQRQQSALIGTDKTETAPDLQCETEIVDQNLALHPMMKPPPPPPQARAFQGEMFQFKEIHDEEA